MNEGSDNETIRDKSASSTRDKSASSARNKSASRESTGSKPSMTKYAPPFFKL